jgi:hypothetical protein
MGFKKLKFVQLPISLFCLTAKNIQWVFHKFSPFPPPLTPTGYSRGLQGGN